MRWRISWAAPVECGGTHQPVQRDTLYRTLFLN